MNIYLIRHGQSMWQTNESLSDDSDLTELGILQSSYLNEHVSSNLSSSNESFSIFVSPMKRSLQTARGLQFKFTLTESIKEASFHVASCLPQHPYPSIYKRKYSEEPGYIEFKNKVKNFINEILTKNVSSIYLYTHAGFIKTFLRLIHDNDCICYTINNCSVTKISWEMSRWKLCALNDTSFMPSRHIS